MEKDRIFFGTWSLGGGDSWGKNDEKESLRVLDLAFDLGFRRFDTAPAYGNGRVEELLGTSFRSKRDKIFIASKCGLEWGESGSFLHKERDGVKIWRNLRRDAIKRQLCESLKRLKCDYLDLYITHWQNPMDPIDETIDTLEELKKEGKIRAWGSSNNTHSSLDAYFSNGVQCSYIQEKWSLLDRSNDSLLKRAEEKNIIMQAYSPLERGLLTGKVKSSDSIEGSAKLSNPWFKRENIDRVNSSLVPMETIAKDLSLPLSSLISLYSLSLSPSLALILGARREEQVRENAKVLERTLSIEAKKEIDRVWMAPKLEEI